MSLPTTRSFVCRVALTNAQFWLLGYEFPTTLMLFTLDTLYILTTQKKGLFALSHTPSPSDR
jgi:nucleosome binding factor SPN SPT16 subunit